MMAVTPIAVQLWQTVASVARSLAGSFWDWLAASGAEYGPELAPPSPAAEQS
jgi:hypothetical protein